MSKTEYTACMLDNYVYDLKKKKGGGGIGKDCLNRLIPLRMTKRKLDIREKALSKFPNSKNKLNIGYDLGKQRKGEKPYLSSYSNPKQ